MPDEIRKGVLGVERGEFFLEVEGRREELPVGIQDEAQLHELVGETVEVLYSVPKPYVVGLVAKRVRCYYILCYYPAPPWLRYRGTIIPAIDEKVRVHLAKRFMEEGLISDRVFEKLV
jgi:hypothetical protein